MQEITSVAEKLLWHVNQLLGARQGLRSGALLGSVR
jgi:hypothetical protein